MRCPTCSAEPSPGGLFEIEELYVPVATERLLPRCAMPARGFEPGGVAVPPQDFPAVAWFRWIVGHQLLFMQWRLLEDSLKRVLGRDLFGLGRAWSAEALLDLCSVLFLYCGSCTPATYLAVLRPAMVRAHPAFSGEWAVDYRAIPRLVREVFYRHRQVRKAWLLNQRIHAAVARQLVPGQPSLLRRAGRRLGAGPSEEEAELFDCFFQVHRTSLCEQGFYGQLSHWLAKATGDLEHFGLYHDSSPVSLSVRGRYGDRIARLESQAVAVLTDQANAVGRI